MTSRVGVAALLACLVIGACAHVPPRPLKPRESLRALEQRHLTDPEVIARVQSALPGARFTGTTWNRAQLLGAALQLNPSLAEARTQVAQTQAQVRTASAVPNPTVSLATEYDLSRAEEPTWLWGVSTSILLADVLSRGQRVEAASAALRGARADFNDAVWSVRRELRSALLGVMLSSRRIRLLESQSSQRAELLRLAQARVAAGEAPRSEALQAELELVRTRAALEEARRAHADARAQLAGAIGVPVAALDGIELRWDDLDEPHPPSETQLTQLRERALLSRPDLERAIADYDARETQLRERLRAQYFQLSIGPGYTWDHGIRKLTLGASASLPVFNQNQGPIAEAVAAREAAGAHALAVQAKILNEIDAATEAYSMALRALASAREQRKASEALANAARRALAIDATDRPSAIAAELAASTDALAEIDALEHAQAALGQLENAVRAPLAGPEIDLFSDESPAALKASP